MAETVGNALLSAFCDVLLEKIAYPYFKEFFETREMNPELLDKLKLSLNAVSRVLDDAESRQIQDKGIKSWLDDLRDAAYKADDMLDEFHYEVIRLKAETDVQANDASAGVKLSENQQKRMEKIGRRLEYLVKQSGSLLLKDGVRKYASSERVPTTSVVEESGIVGRDEDMKNIFELLKNGEGASGIGVISIVGMGGIGKTTLAQLVYNDSRAAELFKIRAWVCVSENYDGFRIKKEVLKHTDYSGACDLLTPNLIDVELKESLKGNKYLLVLDDMWNDNYADWDNLLAPLKGGAQGSKILVTTRNQNVATTVSDIPTYKLRELDAERCWELFVKHAFREGIVDQRFEDTGKKIVRKCQGLPLAAKMLGGLLRSKREVREWVDILDSEIWNLPDNNILPALRLSYQHLPPHLKQCFSYLAIFPKDYKMGKEEIVHLWVAEGFLQAGRGKELEELGKECLDELVSRFFLQGVSCKWPDQQLFWMHDLINDLAQNISGEFLVRLEGDKYSNKIGRKNRHFSCIAGEIDSSKLVEDISEAQVLRTFLTLPGGSVTNLNEIAKLVHDTISQLSCLRVLSLWGFNTLVQLPDCLGNLKQLRYFNIAETSVKKLPESVCTLYKLQILILNKCNELVELPKNMRSLINLHCLDIRETPKLQEMPHGMGNLKELRTLPKVLVGEENGSDINELENLQYLRGQLSVFNLQNVVDTSKDILKNKEHLEYLELRWDGEPTNSMHEMSVLHRLQPYTSIKNVSIFGYRGTKFAAWVGNSSYKHIVSLKLKGCRYCPLLPTLGQLPCLEDLSISEFDSVEIVDDEFCKSCIASVETPFSSLKTLHIEVMKQWQDWVICENDSANCKSFPRLEKLTIFDCPQLKSISTCEPTHKIFKSLNKFDIKDCPDLKISNILAISDFETLEMKGKGRQVSLKKLPSTMYRLDVGRYRGSVECNPRMEGNEEMRFLFEALHFEEIKIIDNSLLQSIPLELLRESQLCVSGCNQLNSLSASEEPVHQSLGLASLEINCCPSLISFPNGGIPAPNLTRLTLLTCSNLKSLPQRMHSLLPSLECLKMALCKEIESFPEGGLPAKLKSLEISGCNNRLIGGRLQWGLQDLNALSHLCLGSYDGDDLDSFPEQALLPSSLNSLEISTFEHLKFIKYQGLQHLTSLYHLKIENCCKVESFSGGLPACLQSLEVTRCDELIRRRLEWGLQRLHALSKLRLAVYFGEDLDFFPEETLLPSTLRSLEIHYFAFLRFMNYNGLQHLTCLAEMELEYNTKLLLLPEEGLPSSLRAIRKWHCPVLQKPKIPDLFSRVSSSCGYC